ncbi:hypothetical protein PG990_013696 [Apiospora arundinis]
MIVMSALCALLGGMVTYILAAFHGLGRHADTVPKEDYKEYLKMTFVQAAVSTIGALACLKISIGFALLRLNHSRRYSQVIWGMIGFVCVYATVSLVEWLVNCRPIAGFWDKSIEAKCLPVAMHKGFALMNTACNIFTDVVFATLPVPVIWRLQMAHRTRVYLIGILSLGYFAVLLGIAKVVCQTLFRGDPDQSFHNWIQFFGFLQVNVGIMAACAPSLKPLVGGVLHLTSTSMLGYGKTDSKNDTSNQNADSSNRRESRGLVAGSPAGGSKKGWFKSKKGTDEFPMTSDMFGALQEQRGSFQGLRSTAVSPSGSEDDYWHAKPEGDNIGIMKTVNFSVSSLK